MNIKKYEDDIVIFIAIIMLLIIDLV